MQYFGSCTFVLPELRVFRASILRVLPVLTVVWEDTANISNNLGLCANILPLLAVLCLAISTLMLRVLAALKFILSIVLLIAYSRV